MCRRDQALISLLCVFFPVLPKKVSKSFSELCVMLFWFKWNSMVPFIIFLKGLKAQFDASMSSCLPSGRWYNLPSLCCCRESDNAQKIQKQHILGCSWRLLS